MGRIFINVATNLSYKNVYFQTFRMGWTWLPFFFGFKSHARRNTLAKNEKGVAVIPIDRADMCVSAMWLAYNFHPHFERFPKLFTDNIGYDCRSPILIGRMAVALFFCRNVVNTVGFEGWYGVCSVHYLLMYCLLVPSQMVFLFEKLSVIFVLRGRWQCCNPIGYLLQLQSIRRCGNLDSFFYMELGQASCLGAGNLWMQAEDSNIAHHMHSVIMK